MPTSWVGASVRARLLGNRRLGRGGASALARADGLAPALELLARSPYRRDVEPGLSLEEAQRRVAATALWNLRLLAGWLPPGGSAVLQPLAAWFEIANIEDRLVFLSGGGHLPPYELGRMGSAWPAVSRATTARAVRAALAASRWGDPGASEPGAMVTALRFRWAAWVATAVPGAGTWAASAAALLGARICLAMPHAAVALAAERVYGLPAGWQRARSGAELRAMLPRELAWALSGVDAPEDLWTAEARWWSKVRADAREALVRARYGPAVVVAVAVLLGHDAWLARAGLGAAARGGQAKAVFDAVA
ncbi:MAG TPA: hypothetical protein VLU92_04710 [Candidatus Dormibacteraeota bacterium]|nr:hypothetical protein [Candidatus Dormibacteraeota bacterium]